MALREQLLAVADELRRPMMLILKARKPRRKTAAADS